MQTKKMYIAGGCFWGLEDLMRTQPGVLDITAGYIKRAGTGRNTYSYKP